MYLFSLRVIVWVLDAKKKENFSSGTLHHSHFFQASQSASLQTIVPILQAYPPIYVRVIWELRNEDREEITCVRFPAKIQ